MRNSADFAYNCTVLHPQLIGQMASEYGVSATFRSCLLASFTSRDVLRRLGFPEAEVMFAVLDVDPPEGNPAPGITVGHPNTPPQSKNGFPAHAVVRWRNWLYDPVLLQTFRTRMGVPLRQWPTMGLFEFPNGIPNWPSGASVTDQKSGLRFRYALHPRQNFVGADLKRDRRRSAVVKIVDQCKGPFCVICMNVSDWLFEAEILGELGGDPGRSHLPTPSRKSALRGGTKPGASYAIYP